MSDEKIDEMTDKQKVIELMDFLTGTVPEGFKLPTPPKLSKEAAFSVVYVLQERYRFISDNIEMCNDCEDIFDMTEEGACFRKRLLCGPCYDNTLDDEPDTVERGLSCP